MTSTTPLGRFVWHDLMTTDQPAAVAFYSSVCGWGTQEWKADPSMPPYTMWTANGTAIGGSMPLPPGVTAPSHWLGYLSTPDINRTVAEARSLGANIMRMPTPIPTVGQFAIIADPQGAVFAAFQPESQSPGHDGPPRVGEFSWFELATRDYNAALAFYGALFGWTPGEAMDMGPNGMYQLFLRDGVMMGGMYNLTAQMPMPPSWCHYVRVGDLTAALDAVKQGGGQVILGPYDVPGGDQIGMCIDPQGAMFALHHTTNG
jgi:predicted enzyme related to lactoylglutathione lyase